MKSIPQMFVDLDGILADLIGHYRNLYHVTPSPDVYLPLDFYLNIQKPGFHRHIPLMPGAREFWQELKQIHPDPIILTGVPDGNPNVDQEKREWVAEKLGAQIKVIPCRSTEKHRFCFCGDVLVDDRSKYKQYWLNVGGIFILHKSNTETLAALRTVYTENSNG